MVAAAGGQQDLIPPRHSRLEAHAEIRVTHRAGRIAIYFRTCQMVCRRVRVSFGSPHKLPSDADRVHVAIGTYEENVFRLRITIKITVQ